MIAERSYASSEMPSNTAKAGDQLSQPIAAPLSPSQLAIVKATAPVMKEHGEAIARLFYGNMLAAHPELHNIFNKTGQDTGAQPRALASAVFAYATYIDDLAQLKDLVERIAQKHVSLVIQPEHYPIVGRYLIEAVAIVLGDAVTPEVAEAWTAAYSALADVFVNREKALYTAHENWSGWRKFRIQKKVIESVEITSFYLVPDDGQPLPLFEPGQYISLHMFIQELGYMQPRQYSLSEAPRSDYYRISVKRESGKKAGIAGLISNILHDNYKEGDIVELTYPAGEFFVNPETDRTTPVVLISAGVGVTPMISILNHSIATNTSRPISWVHGAHSTEVEAFSSHIRQICEKNLNVNATIFKSEVTVAEVKGVDYQFDGRVDLKKLDRERLFLDDVRAEYYICGPTDFMRNAQRFLINSGISKERVHLEIFGVGDGV